MAATARAFVLSRLTDLSPKPQPLASPSTSFFRHNLFLRCPSSSSSSAAAIVSCLNSGGGVSDDFVSTRKLNLDRGFSVIANMLKRIDPLDTSVISKGVSDSAKDSMKQTISTMLGLIPSGQFSVTVRASKHPLYHLLISSIITGYTLWNAEYRLSLMRNLDIPLESLKQLSCSKEVEGSREHSQESDDKGGDETSIQDLPMSSRVLGDLSPEALNYIEQLQSELSDVKEELNSQKQETMQIEHETGNRNDLLEYLRSLGSDMVAGLSGPLSVEVEDIIHQLVQNVLQRFFKDGTTSNFVGDSVLSNTESHQDGADDFCITIGTSQDYLAKLLLWCMLLGHHLRGLENRLHLSCVVRLL